MTRASIRFRLVTRLAVLLSAIALLANAGLYFYLREELIEQYDDALQAQARAVAAVWTASRTPADFAAKAADAFPDLRFGRPYGDALQIVDGDGTLVLRLPSSGGGPWQDPGPRPSTRRNVQDMVLPNGRAGRGVRLNIEDKPTVRRGPATASAVLFLAEDRREMDWTLASFAVWLFVIGGGLSAAAIGLVLAVVRRELRPLVAFSEAVSRLDADSLDCRLPTVGVAEELLPISERLNDLLLRLDQAFQRERRFTGNVAHELRTPLAELRSMVEVAMKWPLGPVELRRHHQNVLEAVQALSNVTQTLLTLVRSDGRLAADLKAVDLVALARAAALPHERTAAERQVRIAFSLPAALSIWADGAILSSLFDNLFSNATLYAAAGSQICVTIGTDPAARAATFAITNDVADLSIEDMPHLIEPFWRKDPARSPTDHAGLGLTLVRVYAEALRAPLRFAMDGPDRLTVSIAFPLPPDMPAEPDR